ncbi:MAG: hypothetical protein HYU66_26525, partial [Armatimonadetes bacterium]|nr:hypothetical protein [Armatimonadota bacterium]
MVRLTKAARRLELVTHAYTLTYDGERPWTLSLALATGQPVAELFLSSSVDTVARRDELEAPGPPVVTRDGEAIVLTFPARSSAWAEKRYEWRCLDAEIGYQVTVRGSGQVADCHLLHGASADDVGGLEPGPAGFRAGYRRPYRDLARGTRPHWQGLLTARPTAAERDLRAWWEDDEIDLVDDPARHGGLDSFLPAPWCHALDLGGDLPWPVVGLAPALDQLGFSRFAYRGGYRCGWELDYGGSVTGSNEWQTPALWLLFGARDAVTGFRMYRELLAERGLVGFPARPTPAWWSRPVLDLGPRATPASATEALARIESQGIAPGTLWLGGWERAEEWPDLRGFVAAQHEAERRVVLDWPLHTAHADVTGRVRELLGESGAGADGLRLREVAPPDDGGPRGCLRVRRALAELREAMDAARPDALLIAPTVNPYFAELVDMVPLGSLWSDLASVERAVRHRALLARAAAPSWLLAVGDWAAPGHAAWRELVELQPQVGVPVIANVERLEETGEA